MSGAYEHNWAKHMDAPDATLEGAFARWQNRLPLYNLRLNNLSAAIIRAQIPEIAHRVRAGRSNHDHVAARLDASAWFSVPRALAGEERAPDSIQFNLVRLDEREISAFVEETAARGITVQVFGQSTDNARAFWNWGFLPGGVPDLPRTRAMLMRACDVRLPARLTRAECDVIAETLLVAAETVTGGRRAYGT
jgi:dTDP-4-amino-4,6-dideoxygalactose transaminase